MRVTPTSTARDRALPRARGSTRATARARLPRVRGRPARGDHRAADAGGHRSARRALGGGGARGAARVRCASMIRAADDDADDLRALQAAGRRAFVRARARRARGAARRAAAATTRGARGPPQLPEVSEPEIVRHYNRLSKRNFDLDTGFYPLGSCTMKHNPQAARAGRGAARPRAAAPASGPALRAGGARADVAPAGRARRDRRAAARLAPAERRARRASWPACCSRAPTTRTAARAGPRCSPPTRLTGRTPRR